MLSAYYSCGHIHKGMNIRTDMFAQLYQDRQTFDLLRSLPASYAEALGKVSAWQKALLILSWSRRQLEGAGVREPHLICCEVSVHWLLVISIPFWDTSTIVEIFCYLSMLCSCKGCLGYFSNQCKPKPADEQTI